MFSIFIVLFQLFDNFSVFFPCSRSEVFPKTYTYYMHVPTRYKPIVWKKNPLDDHCTYWILGFIQDQYVTLDFLNQSQFWVIGMLPDQMITKPLKFE